MHPNSHWPHWRRDLSGTEHRWLELGPFVWSKYRYHCDPGKRWAWDNALRSAWSGRLSCSLAPHGLNSKHPMSLEGAQFWMLLQNLSIVSLSKSTKDAPHPHQRLRVSLLELYWSKPWILHVSSRSAIKSVFWDQFSGGSDSRSATLSTNPILHSY